MILLDDNHETQMSIPVAKITVLGIGGGGGNTVNSIIDSGYQGINFIVANTDAQALEQSRAETKVHIGVKSAKGLGTGANPELGKRAAEEDMDKILAAIDHADIVFLAAGMGGGTGSGALPVIARTLKDHGILTIAVVTKPFLFEGKKRAQVAEAALTELKKDVDTLIVLPNQRLLEVADKKVSMIDAFALINEVLGQSVKGISDIITRSGHINVDFADVRAIMKGQGLAVMGTGKAAGENRARQAALNAISSPLLENMSIEGAHGVLLNITGSRNLGLHEISEAASVVYEKAAPDANIIIGSVIDDSMGDELAVTIIATGFTNTAPIMQSVQPAAVQPAVAQPVAAAKPAQPAQPIAARPEPARAAAAAVMQPAPAERSAEQPMEQGAACRLDAHVEENHALVDLKDLDVPSFLRKEHNQN